MELRYLFVLFFLCLPSSGRAMEPIKPHLTYGGKVNIFFITGTSGSGKSTLVKLLREKLSTTLYEVYDFDENGVPNM